MLFCFGGATRTATSCLSERSDSALTGPKQKSTPLTQDAFLFWRRHPDGNRLPIGNVRFRPDGSKTKSIPLTQDAFLFWRRHPDGNKLPIGNVRFRPDGSKTKKHPADAGRFSVLEAPPGIGPGNKGFADLCLTAWLWRRKNGADYGARTRHLHLGKVALYQMS